MFDSDWSCRRKNLFIFTPQFFTALKTAQCTVAAAHGPLLSSRNSMGFQFWLGFPCRQGPHPTPNHWLRGPRKGGLLCETANYQNWKLYPVFSLGALEGALPGSLDATSNLLRRETGAFFECNKIGFSFYKVNFKKSLSLYIYI